MTYRDLRKNFEVQHNYENISVIHKKKSNLLAHVKVSLNTLIYNRKKLDFYGW